MNVFLYDKTLDGLLTAVFDAYDLKTFPHKLIYWDAPLPLFTDFTHKVVTDVEKSSRVWKGLEKKVSKIVCNMLIHVWLSELPGSDELLVRYMRKAFDTRHSIAMNFADPDVIDVKKLAQKVSREKHHLMEFVRFQKTADGSFFAPVSPEFNSLPLSLYYFKDRFADQTWLIYDTKRRYGFYYDLKTVNEVTLENDQHLLSGKLTPELMANDEKLFQDIWKNYFKAMTIKERINLKLQRQHMPRKYWKYLTEKQ